MTATPKATGPLAEENAFVRFFKALLEFSFKEFITPKIVSILYGIDLVVIALVFLNRIFNVLSDDFADGSDKLLAIFFALAGAFFAVLFVRVVFEIIVVIFKIAEPVTDMARTLHRIEQIAAAGAPVSTSGSAPVPSSEPICPNCGTQVVAGEKFCRSCGHGLVDSGE